MQKIGGAVFRGYNMSVCHGRRGAGSWWEDVLGSDDGAAASQCDGGQTGAPHVSPWLCHPDCDFWGTHHVSSSQPLKQELFQLAKSNPDASGFANEMAMAVEGIVSRQTRTDVSENLQSGLAQQPLINGMLAN